MDKEKMGRVLRVCERDATHCGILVLVETHDTRASNTRTKQFIEANSNLKYIGHRRVKGRPRLPKNNNKNKTKKKNEKEDEAVGRKPSGGIGVAVCQDLGVVERVDPVLHPELKHDSVMWVCITKKDQTKIFVGVGYMAPASSPFKGEVEAVARILTLGTRIFEKEGKVLVAGDFNARFGSMSCIVEIEGEMEYEKERVEFPRESCDGVCDRRGKDTIGQLGAAGLVLVNGSRGVKAEFTNRRHIQGGRETNTVIDVIAVHHKDLETVGPIRIVPEARETVGGGIDHHMLAVALLDVDPPSTAPTPRFKGKLMPKKLFAKEGKWTPALTKEWDETFKDFRSAPPAITVTEEWDRFKAALQQPAQKLKQSMEKALSQGGVEVLARSRSDALCDQLKETRGKIAKQKIRSKLKRVKAQELHQLRGQVLLELEQLKSGNSREWWAAMGKYLQLGRAKAPSAQGLGVKQGILNTKGQEVFGAAMGEVAADYFAKLGKNTREDDLRFSREGKREIDEYCEQFEGEGKEEEKGDGGNTLLNQDVCREEVQKALKKAALHKASDLSGLCYDLFKSDGPEVLNTLTVLLQMCWEQERVPHEWLLGVIVPILKKGDKRCLDNYRGITLLSVVGKLYTSLLNARIMRYAESKGVLIDEQGGFRPRRGTRNHVFMLSEICRNRASVHQNTYACFIDLRKAYDRVYRPALFKRMHEEGIRGKMLRVIMNMYEQVESCVRITGTLTGLFRYDVGLRQGDPLSPVLFNLFINGLGRAVNAAPSIWGVPFFNTIGINTGGIRMMLYADDIVLLAPSRCDLMRSMAVVHDWCHRNRMDINIDKSKVVVFGLASWRVKHVCESPAYMCTGCGLTARKAASAWRFGPHVIEEVKEYRYLGVIFSSNLSWARDRSERLDKFNAHLGVLKRMGFAAGLNSVKTGETIFNQVMRAGAEYGCESWGELSESEMKAWESVQRKAGRAILGVNPNTCDDVIIGDLGWVRLCARMDALRLGFLREILELPPTSLCRQVFEWSRVHLSEWYRRTASLLYRLDLGVVVQSHSISAVIEPRVVPMEAEGQLPLPQLSLFMRDEREKEKKEREYEDRKSQWKNLVAAKIHKIEEEEWRERIKENVKLALYQSVKTQLSRESYLDNNQVRQMRKKLTEMRSGSCALLRIESDRHRERGQPKIPREARICRCCAHTRQLEVVEDEIHFFLDCPEYEDMRKVVIKAFEAREVLKKRRGGDMVGRLEVDDKRRCLLGYMVGGEGCGDMSKKEQEKWINAVKSYMLRAFKAKKIAEAVLP